jgi:methyl-accepting chemotaxis protein
MRRGSLQTKLLLPMVLGGITAVICCLGFMFYLKDKNTELMGLNTAQALEGQVATLRKFYTSEVVSRAQNAGMKVNHDFTEKPNTLPLPATMVKFLGEQIAKDYPGTSIRLYSRYPFPNSSVQAQYDEFENQALATLEKNSSTPFYRLEQVNGRLSIRYAAADIMLQPCVNCHNTHPESPKRDWKVGDLRGVVEVIVPVDKAETTLFSSTLQLAGLVGACFIVILGVVFLLLRQSVIKPIYALADAAQKIEKGDLDAGPKVSNDSKEINFLTSGIRGVIGYLREMTEITESIALGHLAVRIEPKSEVDRVGKSLSKMTRSLYSTITEVRASSKQVKTITVNLSNSGKQLENDSETVAADVQNIASTMEELSINVRAIANNMESQASSVMETSVAINQMMAQLRQVASDAQALIGIVETARSIVNDGGQSVEQASNGMREIDLSIEVSVKMIRELGERATSIDQIIKVINTISDQTNLLALNAAIEAARAGSHGLGFGVVAEEVRKLSDRTAQSAGEITDLIKGVQNGVQQATKQMECSTSLVKTGLNQSIRTVGALSQIRDIVSSVARTAEDIEIVMAAQLIGNEEVAKAMQTLSTITAEIEAASQEQASSINDIVKSVGRVRDISERNASLSERLSFASQAMLSQAEHLTDSIARFQLTGDNLDVPSQSAVPAGIAVQNKPLR